MALSLWAQSIFSKGELSPLMYARTDVTAYFNGMKLAKNVVTFPQGAAGKRFGTKKWERLLTITDSKPVYFQTFQYLNECVYVLVFSPLLLEIYLEEDLVGSVVTTYTDNEILQMDHTVLQDLFIVATFDNVNGPQFVKRVGGAPRALTSFSAPNKTLTAATALGVVDRVVPARFSAPLPTTNPQVVAGQTYFVRNLTATTFKVFRSAQNARADLEPFDISAFGGGNVTKLNTWSINPVTFQNRPVYDFNDVSYSALTFTLSAMVVGNAFLDSSAAFWTTAYNGGVYKQGPGLARITSYVNATRVTVTIVKAFDKLVSIGTDAFVAEPAWSATRGWPQRVSSYQNRLIFANTELIPNGLWLSAINDFSDFNDIDGDSDDAISYYPTSGNLSLIEHIVPYRSLTVHTNSGVYSTPLNLDTAITPANFSLTIQDSTPAGTIQPVTIDNQVIVVSGNDVYTMIWDGLNNTYTSKIVSVVSEQVIDNPVQQAAFSDLINAGSRYALIVNGDGSLAMYQTLLTEDVSGWTRAYTEQSYGEAYFRHVTTNFDGRAWFLTEREIGELDNTTAITVFHPNSLTAPGLGLTIGDVIQVSFATTGTLPTTSPQIVVDVHYWAVGITAARFSIYQDKEDAIAGINEFEVTALGVNSTATSFPLVSHFFIEELDFNLYMDCVDTYSGSPISSLATGTKFNGQEVLINGDGFGYSSVGYSDSVTFSSHGEPALISDLQVGFPINVAIEPMPLSISMGSNIATSNVVEPKHIKNATFMFNNTVGGEINGKPIALKTFAETDFGTAPTASNGIFNYAVMKGWDDFKNTTFTITHSEPFDMKLIGIFYKVEV